MEAMQSPLVIGLRPSATLAAVLAAVHGAGAACLYPLDIAIWLKLAGAAALALSLGFELRRAALLRAHDAIVELVLKPDATIECQQRDGRRVAAAITAHTTVYARLAIVRWKAEGQRRARSIVVLPDAIDADQFRRLRIWLRWQSGVSDGAA